MTQYNGVPAESAVYDESLNRSRWAYYYVDNIMIYMYCNFIMAKKKNEERTRQIYATIREDLYLEAKARATEMRMPLREFIEHALELALNKKDTTFPPGEASVWNDEYLRIQAQQPLGSPVELSREEAAKVVRATFGLDGSRDDDE